MRERRAYSHGGNAGFEMGNERVTDLSASINPLGMPEGVKEAIVRAIPDCERYPDSVSGMLREKIAAFERVNSGMIFCGNGASDIIFRLPAAIKPKKVLVTAPAFADYERAAVSAGARIIRHALPEAAGFAPDNSFIETAERAKPDLVFICNPNNPTGVLTERKLIEKLLDYCRHAGAYVVVDECFLDFVERADKYTAKVFLEKYPNLVVLKAFTKLFALPGIRLGYAICADEKLLESLYFHGADWPVSALAQAAGIAALDGAENFIKKTAAYVRAERNFIRDNLTRLGYRIFESEANYVFLQNPYPFDLCKELDKKGIRIRSCENFYSLDNSYCRIAVSKKEINVILLRAIEEITKNNCGMKQAGGLL